MLLQMASLAILARLITPHDYGLAAMVMSITAIATVLGDFGLSFAAVQAQTLTNGQRSNLFWINTSLGVFLSIVVFLSAESIAKFYGQPDVEGIAKFLAISFVLASASAQYRADHLRNLRFGRVASIDVGAQALALTVAVGMALQGAGYWALVGSTLTVSSVTFICLIISAGWLPQRPLTTHSVRNLLGFGAGTMLTQLINNISANVTPIAIGKIISPAAVGVYTRGHQIFALSIQQLAGPLTSVAVPVLSRLREDPVRFCSYAKQAQTTLCYSVGFLLCLVAVGGEQLVEILLGPGWSEAGAIVQILAAGGAFQVMGYVNYWMFLAQGKMPVLLIWEGVARALMIPLVIGATFYGVEYSAAAYSLGLGLVWFLSTYFGLPRVGLSARIFVLNGIRPLLPYVLVYGAASTLRDEVYSPHLGTMALLLASLGTALLLMPLFLIFRLIRNDLVGLLKLLGNAVSRTAA